MLINFFLIIVLAGRVFSTDFTDCGSQFAIKRVALDGCNEENCILKTAVNMSLSLHALSGFDSDKIKGQVYVMIQGFKFKLKVFPADPCQAIKCPIHPNVDLFYNATFYVDPSLSWHDPVPLTLKLEDEMYGSTRSIVCVQIKVEIPDS